MGSLDGLRVIEFGSMGPVPFCAMMLADHGAEVLRIDRPGTEEGEGWRFQLLNRGRRSIILDLKHPEGVAAALDLIAGADALLEGNRPGVMERLGLGPDICLRRNPRLIYGRMTGWGQTGPLAARAGHDINYLSPTGALWSMGRPDGPPPPPLNLVADLGGGAMFLAFGLLAALLEVGKSGQGQVIDAAMIDGVNSLLTWQHGYLASGFWQDRRGANMLDGGCPWFDSYETADGGYVSVGAIEPQFYAELIRALGLGAEPLPDRNDRANWPALRRILAARFRSRTRDDWQGRLEGVDSCAAVILPTTEAANHPHQRARESFAEIAGIVQPVPAPRFSRSAAALPGPPRRAGADTRTALVDWGLPAVQVDMLLQAGIATQTTTRED